MKKLFLLLLMLLFVSSAVWAGGDLGGGGTVGAKQDPFKLSPSELQLLQGKKTPEEAYQQWLRNMNEQKEVEVLEGVFTKHILPQIQTPPQK